MANKETYSYLHRVVLEGGTHTLREDIRWQDLLDDHYNSGK